VQINQINRSGIAERYTVFKTSGSTKERNQTSSEMGIDCQRNGYCMQRLVICQVMACAAEQGVVVCGRAVCRKRLCI